MTVGEIAVDEEKLQEFKEQCAHSLRRLWLYECGYRGVSLDEDLLTSAIHNDRDAEKMIEREIQWENSQKGTKADEDKD